MIICFELERNIKELIDQMIRDGHYRDYSEAVSVAIYNQSLLHRSRTSSDSSFVEPTISVQVLPALENPPESRRTTQDEVIQPQKNGEPRIGFSLTVKSEVESHGSDSQRRRPPSSDPGNEREQPSGISLPNIIPVREDEWGNYDPVFDKNTALRVRITDEPDAGQKSNGDERHDIYDFLINMDNAFLKAELKSSKTEIELVHKRWQYALVLVGLALLHDDKQRAKTKAAKTTEVSSAEQNGDDEPASDRIEQRIETLTTALAPVLLPMIESLGTLDVEAFASFEPVSESV